MNSNSITVSKYIQFSSTEPALLLIWWAPRIATSGWDWFFQHALRFLFVLSANNICRTSLWACAEWREVRESRTSARIRPSQRFNSEVEILAVNQKEHGLWGYAVSNIGSPSDFSWRTQFLGAKACRVLADFFCRRAADFFVVELQIFLSGHQLAYTSRFFVTTNRVEAWGRVIHNQEWRLCHWRVSHDTHGVNIKRS